MIVHSVSYFKLAARAIYASLPCFFFFFLESEYYTISLVLWVPGIFAEESSPATAKHIWRAVEFAVKLPDIRRSRQQRDRCWPLVGHEINFFVCAKSQTNIRISRATGRQEYSQGLSLPFLKTFAAVFPDSTDRLWVSKDTFTKDMIYTFSHG